MFPTLTVTRRAMRTFATILLCAAAESLNAQTVTTLASFNVTNGKAPEAPVVQGSDGNFYGTTEEGGANSWGVVFKVTPGGALTNLYSFTGGTDGGEPSAGLVQGSDGNFYGTTFEFGAKGTGTVFKITPTGTLTTLHSFANNPDGASPQGALLQATDGNFYGTTLRGGANSDGSVYKITPSGTLTILHSFANGPDGASPMGTLIQATDGNLYGTTTAGAANGNGTVFKITLAGTFTTLYTFGAFAGPQTSVAGLMQAADGNFYGTTSGGGGTGQNQFGTVFKLTLGGTLTTLYSFPNGGGGPIPGMIQGTDGNFYGTTSSTIFRITSAGVPTTLFNSSGNSTTRVTATAAGLIQASDGNLYGTCTGGGDFSDGCVFRLQLAAGAYTCSNTTPPLITSIDSASAYGGYSYFASGSWLEIKGTNLADASDPRLKAAVNPGQWASADFSGANAPTTLDGISVSINGKPAYVWYLSPTQLNVQAPEDTGGNQVITVTNCKATSPTFPFSRRALAPGFLAPLNYTANGTQYMVATFASDGAYVLNTSTGASFGLNSRPAKPGDLIVAYGIGFGDVTPSILPGIVVGQSNTLVSPITVSFGSLPATLSYSGLAGSFVGLYEFYITVPNLANGDYQINVAQTVNTGLQTVLVAVPQTMHLTVHN